MKTPEQKRKAVEATTRHTKKLYRMAFEYKAERGCCDCPERDPYVLQFDHRNRKKKKFSISTATNHGGVSFARLEAEMKKCDIRCANCHIRKSRREGDYRWQPGVCSRNALKKRSSKERKILK